MPSSPNKGYTQPSYGSEVGTWGSDLNNNFTGIVDLNLGGITTVSLSSANVTLSSTQAQNLNIFLTGTLTASVIVSTPCIGFFWVLNNTTGSYTVSLQANFGSGAVGSTFTIPQGTSQLFVSDTTNGLRYGAPDPTTAGVPTGSYAAYAGSTAPTGWLLCYGQAVGRSAYANLYAVISTTYGTGDGSTTFNIPDLRGRTLFGLDNMGGSAAGRLTGSNLGNITSPTTLGSTGGEENHTSTLAETANHGHGVNDSGHSHTYNIGGLGTTLAGGGNWTPYASGNTGVSTTGITIQASGSSASHNTCPPALIANILIKT